jgi:sterol desaturase/sphingolipid hydroxylase (fatty acid hydroxylase superfamily)
MNGALPPWAIPANTLVAFGVLSLAQRRRPLRPAAEGGVRRIIRNLATGGLAFAAVTPLQLLLLAPFTLLVAEHRLGLLGLLELPDWVEVAIAVLLLDYTLWIWHWLNHTVPFLWRFHLAHHVDLDLDASTALRFHFGEMGLSVGYRALQILAIGATPLALSVWTFLLFPSILFHHSNTRLPVGFERALVRWIVTPRMHGIHHSTIRAERDSNFASLLTIWDRLHRKLRLDVPQREVRIGVPPYLDARDVTFGKVQVLPFQEIRTPAAELETRSAAGGGSSAAATPEGALAE